MTIVDTEEKIIERYREEIFQMEDKDSINKLYRQARIWNRFHHFYADACTYERYYELNKTFKVIRWKALEKIDGRNHFPMKKGIIISQ